MMKMEINVNKMVTAEPPAFFPLQTTTFSPLSVTVLLNKALASPQSITFHYGGNSFNLSSPSSIPIETAGSSFGGVHYVLRETALYTD